MIKSTKKDDQSGPLPPRLLHQTETSPTSTRSSCSSQGIGTRSELWKNSCSFAVYGTKTGIWAQPGFSILFSVTYVVPYFFHVNSSARNRHFYVLPLSHQGINCFPSSNQTIYTRSALLLCSCPLSLHAGGEDSWQQRRWGIKSPV